MADTVGGTSSPAATRAPAPSGHQGGVVPQEWPAQLADTIVDNVGKVRDRTTGPAIKASRAVVYGLVAAVLGIMAVTLLLIFVIRLADNYLPGPLWITYLVLGALFTIGGVVFWVRAFKAPVEPTQP